MADGHGREAMCREGEKFVKLTRNPYHKDGFGVEPTVGTVLFEMYQQQDSLVDDYKMGNLDAAIELDPGYYKVLKSMPGSTIVAARALGFHELGMNSRTRPTTSRTRSRRPLWSRPIARRSSARCSRSSTRTPSTTCSGTTC